MERKLDQSSPINDGHKGVFFSLLGGIVIIGILGTVCFFVTWRQGDMKAQALSGFLAFFAAWTSSVATVFYVYLTNKSLRKAQESIALQQEQLEQTKSALELQRSEWEQKVRVFPQFWIKTDEEMQWYMLNPQYPNGTHLLSLSFGKRFKLEIWNYSEQSFLVESILTQRSDVYMVGNQQRNDIQIVVKPHSVETIDISASIMRLLTQTLTGNVMMKEPDANARVFVRLIYCDWSQKQAESEVREFEFVYRVGDQDITIRSPQQSSRVRPSI